MAELVIILGVQAVVLGTIYGVNYSNSSHGFGTTTFLPWGSEGAVGEKVEEREKMWVGDEDPIDEELSSAPVPIFAGAAEKKQAAMAAARVEAHRLDEFKEEMEMAY